MIKIKSNLLRKTMRICITNKYKTWDNAKTGKGLFVKRLIPALERLGCQVTTDPKKDVDITLGIGKFVFSPKGKAVLRLGDAHKEKDHKKLNKPKKNSIEIADGIIYQSGYSMKLCRIFIGEPKCTETVIFNGANPKAFNVEPYDSPYKHNFLASARVWTPQKRLLGIKRVFLESDVRDSCLFICGEVKTVVDAVYDSYNKMEIRFLGMVDQKTLASLYKTCCAMLDATWLTACPNNVVEALVAGCPVISQNASSVCELGLSERHDKAFYLIQDREWDMKKPVDFNKRRSVSRSAFIQAIKDVTSTPKTEFTYKSLHIDNIAKQYLGFFEKVLR